MIRWDGTTLEVSHHVTALARIEGARWIYRDHAFLAIAPDKPITRFNFGHVKSNGRELTVDGFFGSGFGDLPAHLETLGPRKRWLWRRMPF